MLVEIFRMDQENLKQVQRGDVICWLERGGPHPHWQDIVALGEGIKSWWARYETLRLSQGVLRFRWEGPEKGSSTWKVVAPIGKVPDILRLVHVNHSTGYLRSPGQWSG